MQNILEGGMRCNLSDAPAGVALQGKARVQVRHHSLMIVYIRRWQPEEWKKL